MFGKTWGWINDDKMIIFGLTIPLIKQNKATEMFLDLTNRNHEEKRWMAGS